MSETERIASLAAELFHEHGITATGVDALSKAAGISKRTLYERFGSKDGLIVAAYDSLDLPVFEMLTGPAEAASDDAARAARRRSSCSSRRWCSCRSSAGVRS